MQTVVSEVYHTRHSGRAFCENFELCQALIRCQDVTFICIILPALQLTILLFKGGEHPTLPGSGIISLCSKVVLKPTITSLEVPLSACTFGVCRSWAFSVCLIALSNEQSSPHLTPHLYPAAAFSFDHRLIPRVSFLISMAACDAQSKSCGFFDLAHSLEQSFTSKSPI
jgi:hypothetical protein